MRATIIGTGGIAEIHARAIRLLGGEIVGVCGRSKASAEGFGAGRAYGDVQEMLDREKLDVVHVCSPNYLHKEHVLAAFSAGSHVVCEKPIAISIGDAEAMIEAAKRSGKIGAIMYHNRGYPLVQLMKERIASGEVGRLLRIGGCYMNDEGLSPERFTWHFVSERVGGSFAMMDIGVHWLDLAEHVTGHSICEISALFSTHTTKRTWTGQSGQGPAPQGRPAGEGVEIDVTVEDHAEVLVRFEGGASGSATISTVSSGYPNFLSLSIDGTNLGMDWTQQEPDWFLERRSEGLLKRVRRLRCAFTDRTLWRPSAPRTSDLSRREGNFAAEPNRRSQRAAGPSRKSTPHVKHRRHGPPSSRLNTLGSALRSVCMGQRKKGGVAAPGGAGGGSAVLPSRLCKRPQLLADAMLDNAALKDLVTKKF